jgi:hypothetical protein
MSWDLFWRGVQVAGGTLEVIGGGAMAGVGALGAPVTGGTSLLATVGGAAIGAHGLDQIYAGLTGTPSVASQLGGAAAAAVLGPDYAYIGEFLGDLGPGAAGVWKGVKSLPQLFKNLRAIPGKMKSFIDDLRGAGKLSETLKGLPDEEIAEMLKRGEITDKDLIEAGVDPAKYKGGAKSTKAPPKTIKVLRQVSPDEAREWLRTNQPHLSEAKIESYLKSFDLQKPLEIVEVPEGYIFETHKYPSSRIDPNATMSGNQPPGFVTDIGSDPSRSAIHLPGRSPGVASTNSPTEALRGTTGNWPTDQMHATGVGGQGGNTQYILPNNSASFDGFGPH